MFHLPREPVLNEDGTCFYDAELLVALKKLHAMDVVHRDIKPYKLVMYGKGERY